MKRAAVLAASVSAVLLAASLVGCGSKSRANNQVSINRAQLALMPLPKSELGVAAKRLPLDPDSGVQTNADAADNANSSKISAKTLQQLGRITGYQLDYNDVAGAALTNGRGLLTVTTSVELYLDEKSAERGFALWRRDETIVPAAIQALIASFRNKPFPTKGIGDAAFSYEGVMVLKGFRPITGSDVVFRTGQLVAKVSVSAGERTSTRAFTVSLARKLQARIEKVLSGEIKEPPVPLPKKAEAGPPPNGPDLSALALTPRDLGKGTVTKHGYQLDTDLNPVSEYERTMEPGGRFLFLNETVALFRSSLQARLTISILASAFSSEKEGKKQTGFAVYAPKLVQVSGGDEARAVIARVKEKPGDQALDEAIVLIRIRKTMEFVVGVARSVSPADIKELATITADRAKAGLAQK